VLALGQLGPWNRSLMTRTYVALDLELTGLDYRHDDIIEIGMVKFRGRQVLETYSSVINSPLDLPYKIERLIGISRTEIDHAPTLRSIKGRIVGFVQNLPVIGHSIATDLRFLNRHGLLPDNQAIDTFELASIVLPAMPSYSLAHLAESLGIDMDQKHRALSDAKMTKDLFLALLDRVWQWDSDALEEIAGASAHTNWSLGGLFRQLAAERRARQGMSLVAEGREYSPAESSTGLPVQQERHIPAPKPSPTITPIDTSILSAMIAPGGQFERAFPGYEHRPQQVEMLVAVAEAFNTPAHLLVEAGSGVGKSLAYLLPAVCFATQNGRRVVISSNTINLQDQLYNKDIPDLQRVLSIAFRAALLKGRTNYICLRRLAAFRRLRQFSTDEVRALAKILAWLPTTETGDRTELLLLGSDSPVWSQVQASPDTCMGDICPFRRNGQCFYYRARERAERAHLVIVNHSLLLTDLMLENRILPKYQYLIIDEAHHLEERATEQFGLHAGRRDIRALLAGLHHQRRDRSAGLLSRVAGWLAREGASHQERETIASRVKALGSEVDRAQQRLAELFHVLAAFIGDQVEVGATRAGSYDQHVRLTPGLRAQPDWVSVEIAWERFSDPMSRVFRGLEALLHHMRGLNLGENSTRDELVLDMKAQLQLGTEMWSGLDRVLMRPDRGGIYWFSISGRDQEITLHSAPLHVGPTLQEKLFSDKDCVVLTSATLRTGGSFSFIKERLGLEDPIELALDSPFDFKTAALLYVPKDMPEPNRPRFQESVERAIIELCRATEGRTLVLFTSTRQLRATYRGVLHQLEQDGIVVYGQGLDGSRNQILESFRNTPKSVLMGTRSFWEGIDVVGPALGCLVIARLPFSVPTDPVFAARAETMDDPFNELYVPNAILRFRQGFGRLIRSKDDYGLVVVLDKRLLTKAYGKAFLRSLPRCTARQGPLESLPRIARGWLDPEIRKRPASQRR